MKKFFLVGLLTLVLLLSACANGIDTQAEQANQTPMVLQIDLVSTPATRPTETEEPSEATQALDTRFVQNLDLYRDILDRYYEKLYEKPNYSEEDTASQTERSYLVYSIVQPYCTWETETGYSSGVGFAFQDLNADGVDELLLGWVTSEYWRMDEGYVFGIYTIVDGTVTLAVEGAERCRYIISKEGYVYQNGSDSAWESSYIKYSFDLGSERYLDPIEEIFSFMNDQGNCSWAHITDPNDIGKIEYSEGRNEFLMNEDEALLTGETWIASGAQLVYTRFSEYTSFR